MGHNLKIDISSVLTLYLHFDMPTRMCELYINEINSVQMP